MNLLETIVEWEERLAIRRSVVLFVTLWMTWRAFTWAAEYASRVALTETNAIAAAAMIAAVTAPIAVLQGYVFKAYIDSKGIT